MTNHNASERTSAKERKPRRRAGPKILLAIACYLCVLVAAIRVDGMVEAQAQYEALVAEAEEVRQTNIAAVESARLDTIMMEQANAELLATVQQEARLEREAEAAAAAVTTGKPQTTTTGTGTGTGTTAAVAPVAAPAGKFNAGAYGGFNGVSKASYWYGVNSDTIGYLHIPGTNISHAVVQNTQDINYYLERGYDKNYSRNGVLWTNTNTNSAGSSSNMSSNTVIFGHNWTNVSANPRIGGANDVFFAQLTAYHHLSMAKSYPYFYYSTTQENMVFKIFACFYTEPAFNYIQTEGNTQNIIDEALRRSRHDFDVAVDGSDKIITLSTCTRAYGATGNQRFVVMGRLLRPGESITEVGVTSNPNHKQPNVW